MKWTILPALKGNHSRKMLQSKSTPVKLIHLDSPLWSEYDVLIHRPCSPLWSEYDVLIHRPCSPLWSEYDVLIHRPCSFLWSEHAVLIHKPCWSLLEWAWCSYTQTLLISCFILHMMCENVIKKALSMVIISSLCRQWSTPLEAGTLTIILPIWYMNDFDVIVIVR
jgi:hypothetical protein